MNTEVVRVVRVVHIFLTKVVRVVRVNLGSLIDRDLSETARGIETCVF